MHVTDSHVCPHPRNANIWSCIDRCDHRSLSLCETVSRWKRPRSTKKCISCPYYQKQEYKGKARKQRRKINISVLSRGKWHGKRNALCMIDGPFHALDKLCEEFILQEFICITRKHSFPREKRKKEIINSRIFFSHKMFHYKFIVNNRSKCLF